MSRVDPAIQRLVVPRDIGEIRVVPDLVVIEIPLRGQNARSDGCGSSSRERTCLAGIGTEVGRVL